MAKPGKTIPGPELPHTLPVGRVLPDSPPLTRQGAPPRLSTPSCSWSPQEPCQGQTHGQVALPAPPPTPWAPLHPRGAPPSPALRNTNNLVRRPEGRSPPGTSRTQGQAGQGQGGQTRGLSGERKCRPCSHPSLPGPHVLLQMKDGGGHLPSQGLRAPTVSPSTPPSQPTFPPKPGGLGMPRVLEGRPAYSPPASSAWQLLGANGGPRPTQELWDKGRQGSLLPCWGCTQPWPSTQATTDDPLHNQHWGQWVGVGCSDSAHVWISGKKKRQGLLLSCYTFLFPM